MAFFNNIYSAFPDINLPLPNHHRKSNLSSWRRHNYDPHPRERPDQNQIVCCRYPWRFTGICVLPLTNRPVGISRCWPWLTSCHISVEPRITLRFVGCSLYYHDPQSISGRSCDSLSWIYRKNLEIQNWLLPIVLQGKRNFIVEYRFSLKLRR